MALSVADERDVIIDELNASSEGSSGGPFRRLLALLLDNMLASSVGSFVLGVVLVLIAEFGDIHEARIFGAGLISSAGIGFGIATGLADPRKLSVPEWLKSWRATIGVIAAALAIAPAIVVLGGVLVGTFGDADGNRSGTMLVTGFLVALLMLLATAVTGGISIRAITQAANEPAEKMVSEELGAHVDEA